jgi:2-succinyl-6-hydroxy-2,4-cyclohexadiene-1-carboxylate synthase
VEVRGLSYAVRLERRGEPSRAAVVFVHGFAGSSEDWTDTAAEIVDGGFDVAGIDLPGHGGTAVPDDATRFSVAETAADLAPIARALGLERPHWVGYSMGGRIALHLGLSRPESVASLVLESASPGITGASDRMRRLREDGSLAAEIESRGVAWFVEHWASVPIFETQRRLPPQILEAQTARRLRNRPEGLAGSLRGAGQGAQECVTPLLPLLRAPTLLLAGALDTKYANLAAELAAAIPGAERRIVPDSGHNIHLEQPGAFRRALTGWLRSRESAPPTPAPLHA